MRSIKKASKINRAKSNLKPVYVLILELNIRVIWARSQQTDSSSFSALPLPRQAPKSSPVLSNKMKWLWSSILTQLCIISAAAEKPALYLSVCQPEQFVFGWIALGDSFMESRPKLAALPAKNKSLILTIMRDMGKKARKRKGKGRERSQSNAAIVGTIVRVSITLCQSPKTFPW